MKKVISLLALALLFCACTSGPADVGTKYTVGGNITGLTETVVLQNNGGDGLTLSSDGAFTFATEISNGATYAVTVFTQPPDQTCTVTGGDNGSGGGTVNGQNVTSVVVTCADNPTSLNITPADRNLVLRTLTQYRVWDSDGIEHTEEAEWSSDDESVFTVSNTAGTKGLVTANALGDSRIHATYNGESAYTTVTVIGGLHVVSDIPVSDLTVASIGNSNTSRNIAVDHSLRIHTVWARTDSPVQIRYSRSVDLGDSFESSVQVDDGGATLSATVEPVIATEGNDYVYISYLDTAGSVYLVRSEDGGDTWTTPVKVADSLGISRLSITTYNEYLYILAKTSPMKLIVSNDHGATSSIITTAISPHAYEDVLADPSNGDVYIMEDDPTLYWAVSHDNGATFSDVTHITDVSVYYSDYTISQLGSIFIAGAGDGADAAIFEFADLSFTQVNYTPTGLSQQVSTAIDGLNMIHIIANTGAGVYLYDSTDGGSTYSNQLIKSGATKPDIAPSTFVDGAPILYLKDNSIYYTFVRDE